MIMDLNQVMSELDELFTQDRIREIPDFLMTNIKKAQEEKANDILLTLYNECIGYFRETGEYDKAVKYCKEAESLIDEMELQDTIPYATTLLNAANGYRAAGLLKESMERYERVEPIYKALLAPNDMYFAGLYNNISLLYQELGDFRSAKDYLELALNIDVQNPDTQFEIAVTQANLANTCIELGQYIEAKDRAKNAVEIFESIGVDDAHYSAALSALGSLYYMEMDYENALAIMKKSRSCVAKYLGDNNIQCERLDENIRIIEEKLKASKDDKKVADKPQNVENMTGLEICRKYYEEYGKKMIADKFGSYESKIAVGLVGKGSDCFGFDDIESRDHDFGPRFCMWVTKQTYEEIGDELQSEYEKLPDEYLGIKRIETFHGRDRAGVFVIEDFYKDTVGADIIGNPENIELWLSAYDYALAAAVNGEVFRDDEGIFTSYRNRLKSYYPKAAWYRKLAQACALFSQNGQYNLPRMRKRGQLVSAELAKAECMKQAMLLDYLLNKQYAPHDKWLFKALPSNPNMVIDDEGMENETVATLVEKISRTPADDEHKTELTKYIEALAVIFANELEHLDIIGKADIYLDANTTELVFKSDALINASKEKMSITDALSLYIARAEFEAFDKVQNEGGRADCQNNWPTFKVMRMSQYMTWDEDMLLQYLYEFRTNYENGRNMIQEKYARMMESTAPREYAKFADKLPPISAEKKAIMEQIIAVQVKWTEEFAAHYPHLAGNARYIHTSDDMPYDTSSETYLRGELGTYSDRMLAMYGRYIVKHASCGKNVVYEIMENTIHFYGYKDFETAEKSNV
jgi:tetratricopeptide (TPR) repeat protein